MDTLKNVETVQIVSIVAILSVIGLCYVVYKIITTDRSIRIQKGPSKEPQEKNLEIVHEKCRNKIYYSDYDIILGDLELISQNERLRRGYINCPHCKTQLVFDYND